jgi:hypothetical protein
MSGAHALIDARLKAGMAAGHRVTGSVQLMKEALECSTR